jgi:hypothetical protein
MTEIDKIKKFKDFKTKKETIEAKEKILSGYYDFSKAALISEFSLQDLFSSLNTCKSFLTKHYLDYYKMSGEQEVNSKVVKVLDFDENKMIFSMRNYLPRNMCRIYQPIDSKTNYLTVYDVETEMFKKVELYPETREGFSFCPFARYLNFGGRVFVTGGYSSSRTSSHVWVIEEDELFRQEKNKIPGNKNKSAITTAGEKFYNNLSDKYKFKDKHGSGFTVMECSKMNHARAGHAMLGIAPSLVMVFGGTDNNKSCEIFYFDENHWEDMSQLNESRIDASAFVYKNHIYVFGGLYYHRPTKKYKFLKSFERISLLNPQSSTWEHYSPKEVHDHDSPFKLERSLSGIVFKNDSSIYLCGGQVDKDRFSNDIFELNLELNTVTYVDKKLQKPCAFLERNFIYLFKTAVNFDISGDIFYYQSSTDSFNFQFQKPKEIKLSDNIDNLK